VTLSERDVMVLHYGDERIPYAVRTSAKRRERVEINVLPNGAVEVEAPEAATPEAIAMAVQKRARWIVSHVSDARKRFEHVLPREYVSGEQALYLGRRYSLKVLQVPKAERAVRLKGALLIVAHEDTRPDSVRAILKGWYRAKARDYFAQRIEATCAALPWPQDPPPFRLLEMATQWGSCAVNGDILLNPALVRAPRECIDYVITHEVCHLREHNHSPEFFRLLTKAVPHWEGIKQRLDAMAEVLLND
jgi:predicted metal-dependent hydrolase